MSPQNLPVEILTHREMEPLGGNEFMKAEPSLTVFVLLQEEI